MADEVIGKRVICEGFRGVIKYVGEVPPTSGKWADYLFNSINNEIKECLCALKPLIPVIEIPKITIAYFQCLLNV